MSTNDFIIALIILIVISIIYTIACCVQRAPETIDMPSALEQARYGFAPVANKAKCPAMPCLAGNSFIAEEATCHALGGTSVGRSQIMVSADERAGKKTGRRFTNCSMYVSPANKSTYGISPHKSCGATRPVYINTTAEGCAHLKGKPFMVGDEMFACQMDMCPIRNATLRLTSFDAGLVPIGVGLGDMDGQCRLMGGDPTRSDSAMRSNMMRRGKCRLSVV